MTWDDYSLEVLDRRVTLDLDDRSRAILGYHWDLFEADLLAVEFRALRLMSQITVTVEGERFMLDDISDDAMDVVAERYGELLRDATLRVIEREDLVNTGEFRDDVSLAPVVIEEI